MTFLTRQAFAKQFGESPDDLDMHVIYDVSHNIAKVRTVIGRPPLPCCNNLSDLPLSVRSWWRCTQQVEQHMVDGRLKTLLVHRKGSTRAFPPHHPLIPVDYQFTGTTMLQRERAPIGSVCF